MTEIYQHQNVSMCVCVNMRRTLYDAVEFPAFNPSRLEVFKQKFAISVRFTVHCSVKLFHYTQYIRYDAKVMLNSEYTVNGSPFEVGCVKQ